MIQRTQIRDRRIQKTETLLRDALMSLIREKAYDAIVIKEILDRANVGRTTFYTHFRDKDELLASGIKEMLRPVASSKLGSSAKSYEQIIRFSITIFEYLQQHRDEHLRTHDARMDADNRAVLHQHLQDVLTELIKADVEQCLRSHGKSADRMPVNILANYLASTFVLVLNWWVENDSPLRPKEVNEIFRALVLPTLVTILQS